MTWSVMSYCERLKEQGPEYEAPYTKYSFCLIKFLVNTIHIYSFKIIYYKNTFRN
jgi:hypothetical protein